MLIPFHSPDASDSTWVRPLLQSEGLALCDYSFPVLFCWKDAYGFQYAPLGKRLLVRLTSSLGHSYLWPAGEGDPTPALDALTLRWQGGERALAAGQSLLLPAACPALTLEGRGRAALSMPAGKQASSV